MKKICSVFIAALLAVMLCVPAFAIDYQDSVCEHLSEEKDCIWLFDDEGTHILYCLICDTLIPASLILGADIPHSDSCFVCREAAYAIDMLPLFSCPQLSKILAGDLPSPDVVSLYLDGDNHCFYCADCGSSLALSSFSEELPHTDDCFVCAEFSDYGFAIIDPPSAPTTSAQGILPAVSSIVTSAIEWLSAFVLCIVSNPLLLVFVVCVFVGLGIGLVKRIIRL